MKQRKYLRPLIAGLSLAVLSTGALAYGSRHGDDGDCQRSSGHMMQQQAHGDQDGYGHHGGRAGWGGQGGQGMMRFAMSPDLVESLKLDDTQKLALFEAQTAASAMRDSMRETREQMRAEFQSGARDSAFDPRAMFEAQNKRMAARQQARQAIQGQWLAFWDGLDDQQKSQLQETMSDRMKSGGSRYHRD
ncbi:MAG: Spy/CpxP family protein refolding chaperone [Orrella sp.]